MEGLEKTKLTTADIYTSEDRLTKLLKAQTNAQLHQLSVLCLSKRTKVKTAEKPGRFKADELRELKETQFEEPMRRKVT